MSNDGAHAVDLVRARLVGASQRVFLAHDPNPAAHATTLDAPLPLHLLRALARLALDAVDQPLGEARNVVDFAFGNERPMHGLHLRLDRVRRRSAAARIRARERLGQVAWPTRPPTIHLAPPCWRR